MQFFLDPTATLPYSCHMANLANSTRSRRIITPLFSAAMMPLRRFVLHKLWVEYIHNIHRIWRCIALGWLSLIAAIIHCRARPKDPYCIRRNSQRSPMIPWVGERNDWLTQRDESHICDVRYINQAHLECMTLCFAWYRSTIALVTEVQKCTIVLHTHC